jgi:hypothetical protein
MLKPIIYILLGTILWQACEKQDIAVTLPPPASGQNTVTAVQMGKDYENQIFFNLEGNTTKVNPTRNWDLAFESSPEGFHILMNGGNNVQVYKTTAKNFAEKLTLNPFEWQWDSPDGNPDSTGIGQWLNPFTKNSFRNVYVLDWAGTPHPKMKLQILYVNDNEYSIKYSKVDDKDSLITIIKKDASRNLIYFTFDQMGKIINNEPPKNSWDIVFLRYRHIYKDMKPPFPYIVSGVFMNKNGIGCCKDSTTGYENITLTQAISLSYHYERDYIGFDWKTFDSSLGRYTTKKYITYIIKARGGKYYKLRFIDFYNSQGEKGNPKFEYQLLK